jgi:glutathione synthase
MAHPVLFWMDSPQGIHPKKDTTYSLIKAAFQQNLSPQYIKSIHINNGQLHITAQAFSAFEWGDPLTLVPQDIQHHPRDIFAIWLRKDPPVNRDYINDLLIFNQFKSEVMILNDPTGILMNNEKLAATRFQELTPKTLISSQKTELLDFIRATGSCVIKPLDGFGGQGIFKTDITDTNLGTIIEVATMNEVVPIVCQKAVDHTNGDKRILLLEGSPIGAVNRINPSGHRNNFMSGGLAEKATITDHDQTIIQTIAPFLKSNGLFFVGIDIIHDHLIEINVTSPMGIQEVNRLDNVAIHDIIISEMIKRQGNTHA